MRPVPARSVRYALSPLPRSDCPSSSDTAGPSQRDPPTTVRKLPGTDSWRRLLSSAQESVCQQLRACMRRSTATAFVIKVLRPIIIVRSAVIRVQVVFFLDGFEEMRRRQHGCCCWLFRDRSRVEPALAHERGSRTEIEHLQAVFEQAPPNSQQLVALLNYAGALERLKLVEDRVESVPIVLPRKVNLYFATFGPFVQAALDLKRVSRADASFTNPQLLTAAYTNAITGSGIGSKRCAYSTPSLVGNLNQTQLMTSERMLLVRKPVSSDGSYAGRSARIRWQARPSARSHRT
jgi:hypothetical protein